VQARNSGWWWIAGVAAVLVAIGSTRLGAWTQSFLGAGVRWQQAHTALETAESNLPRNSRERERLLLATAQADAEPASGLAIGPRLHKAGTLARLRYETFDEKFPPQLIRPIRGVRLYDSKLASVALDSPGYFFLATDSRI
jgi:hypothetical protein